MYVYFDVFAQFFSGIFYPFNKTSFKTVDNRSFFPTDKANSVCFGCVSCSNPCQVRRFVVFKSCRYYIVLTFDHIIDQTKVHVRILHRCARDIVFQQVANPENRVEPICHSSVDVVRIIGSIIGLEVIKAPGTFFQAIFLTPCLQTFPSRLVKGFVVYTTGIGDQGYAVSCIIAAATAVFLIRARASSAPAATSS